MSMNKTANMPGQLVARFVRDKDGKPEFFEDTTGLKHYRIDLSFEPAPAKGVEGVTFFLDASYHDPVRLVDKEVNFTERISSYGDFPVIAKVETDDFSTVSGTLAKLLRRGHPDADKNPALSQAIADIASH